MSVIFGHLLKDWRGIRRFSQLSLSTETGISSRHISFLETGRAKPSRGCVLTLARALDIPKPIVNDALLAAGFAPEYPAHDLSDVNLKPMMDAMATILDNHAPFPAIIIDGNWQIVGGNMAAMHLVKFLPFQNTGDQGQHTMGQGQKTVSQGSLCVVDALLNDSADDPIFLNWDEIAAWTLTRLQRETSHLGRQGPLVDIYKRLAHHPRCAAQGMRSKCSNAPYLTMKARIDGHDLSLFTMLAEFTTAQDVAMSERRVELFFPADAPSRAYFEALQSGV